MLRRLNFPELIHAYGNLVLQATLPGAKKPPCVASAFLGKCTSITAVDLIQRKKFGSWKLFESNLDLISYRSIGIMTVYTTGSVTEGV